MTPDWMWVMPAGIVVGGLIMSFTLLWWSLLPGKKRDD